MCNCCFKSNILKYIIVCINFLDRVLLQFLTGSGDFFCHIFISIQYSHSGISCNSSEELLW